MSSPESGLYSSLRAVRKVVSPSQSLKELLYTARILSDEVEPVDGLLDPLVYAGEGLRVTIYQRRLRASEEANELIRKMYTRMESPMVKTTRKVRQPSGVTKQVRKSRPNMLPAALRDVEDLYLNAGQPLTVRANKIVVSAGTDNSRIGTEFALVIDEGIGASVLEAQQSVLTDAESRIVIGRKIRRMAEGQTEALEMPFMRVPLTNSLQRDEFIQLLSTELPVHDIVIGPVEWKPSTVAYIED